MWYYTVLQYTCYEPFRWYLVWYWTPIPTLNKVSTVLHGCLDPHLDKNPHRELNLVSLDFYEDSFINQGWKTSLYAQLARAKHAKNSIWSSIKSQTRQSPSIPCHRHCTCRVCARLMFILTRSAMLSIQGVRTLRASVGAFSSLWTTISIGLYYFQEARL